MFTDLYYRSMSYTIVMSSRLISFYDHTNGWSKKAGAFLLVSSVGYNFKKKKAFMTINFDCIRLIHRLLNSEKKRTTSRNNRNKIRILLLDYIRMKFSWFSLLFSRLFVRSLTTNYTAPSSKLNVSKRIRCADYAWLQCMKLRIRRGTDQNRK